MAAEAEAAREARAKVRKHKQTMTAYCRILPTLDHHVSDIFFQVVQTQTATAYCRILPTLDHHV
jgi:hypothetical protein